MAAADDDARFMRRAIAIAREAGQAEGAVPIGCVIVRDGEIVGEGANEVAEQSDPTAHAEIVAIRRASRRLGPDLRGATLYSTLQPCGMCSMASIWSHVSRIVYSAERDQVHSMYFEDRHFDTMDFIRDAFREDMTFTGGMLAEESVDLYHKPDEDVPEAEKGNE
jgi:tRNA(adenine34) deaminase